jgi:hypothetical protein
VSDRGWIIGALLDLEATKGEAVAGVEARSIPAAPIHTPGAEPIWLNHAVQGVRDVRSVR